MLRLCETSDICMIKHIRFNQHIQHLTMQGNDPVILLSIYIYIIRA